MNNIMNENTGESQTTQTPEPAAEDTREKLQSDRDGARARHGKIGALPADIRSELNRRLERGEGGPELLAWLNGLPEVVEILKDNFGGLPINKQNLSAWRKGGYLEWQTRQELTEAAAALTQGAREVTQTFSARELADNLAITVAAQFARLLNRWDGEPDPKFEAKLQILRRLTRDVVQLQRSIHQADKQNKEAELFVVDEEERVKQAYQKELLAPIWAVKEAASYATLFRDYPAAETVGTYLACVKNGLTVNPMSLDRLFGPVKTRRVKPGQGKSAPVKPDPEQPSRPEEPSEAAPPAEAPAKDD
jgi:hypothetical protein